MSLVIEQPGMFSTIQDGGRHGFGQWGVPVSGPMDRWSARLANRLVGNPDGAPVIEVTLVGPRVRVERDCAIAITGAVFEIEAGTHALQTPWSGTIAAGTTVAFGKRRAGARAYVAAGGSFRLPRVLGSRSTLVRAPFAGLAGRALRGGDVVPLDAPRTASRTLDADALNAGSDAARTGSLRLLRVLAPGEPSPAFDVLCTTAFAVSTRSDRMGYRLEGAAAWGDIAGELLSGPTTLGAVQLPPGGEPILLMADHQTTGGYAQIAVLCRADRQLAGQLAPGDRVAFAPISRDAARIAHAERERALELLAPEVVA